MKKQAAISHKKTPFQIQDPRAHDAAIHQFRALSLAEVATVTAGGLGAIAKFAPKKWRLPFAPFALAAGVYSSSQLTRTDTNWKLVRFVNQNDPDIQKAIDNILNHKAQ